MIVGRRLILLKGLQAEYVLSDRGYDSNEIVESIERSGAKSVIPPGKKTVSNSAKQREYDTEIYKERNLVERLFNKLRHWRRIATRSDKTAESFPEFVHLAASIIWMK